MPTRQTILVTSVFFALVLALTFSFSSFGGQSQAAAPINTYFETRTCLDGPWPPSEAIGCTSDLTAGAVVDTTTSFIIPSGSPNFNQDLGVMAFTPPDVTFHEDTNPIGGMAGAFRSRTTLGLINGACGPGKNTDVQFAFFNGTVDPVTDGVLHPSLPEDAGDLGTLEYFGTDQGDNAAPNSYSSENGIPVHAEKYPSYLLAMFDPDFVSLGPDGRYNGYDTGSYVPSDPGDGPDPPVIPAYRYGGYTVVAGMGVVLEYIVFAPGSLAAAFDDPHPYSDFSADLGYGSMFVLNDPTLPDAPSSISDFCTVLSTTHLGFGESRDNPCSDGSADPYTGPCPTDGQMNTASTTGSIPPDLWYTATPDACDTDSDESGCIRYRNPAAGTGYANTGTHRAPNFTQTYRDADNDGIENAFDTCPYTATPGYNPRVTDLANDADADAIPGGGPAGGCDPTPGVNTGLGNHDGDVGGVLGSPYLNGQDNCPLAANGTGGGEDNQNETETDTAWATAAPNGGSRGDNMGDACDSEGGGSDSVADGHFHTFLNLGLTSADGYKSVSCIGATDTDGDGVCDTTEDLLGSYKYSKASTPEHLSFDYAMPLTNRGSGPDDDADNIPNHDEPGPADDDPAGSAGDQEEEPFQSCNDNIDNDTDGLKDNAEADCGGAGANPDTDLDGIKDAQETACGPAGIELDATKVPERLANSVDDDGDTNVDNVHAPVAGFDCDGDGYKDDIEAGLTWPPQYGPTAEDQATGECNDVANDDYPDLVDSTEDLAEDLDDAETDVDMTDGTAFAKGDMIRVDAEDMKIMQNVAGNTLTVQRGASGTTKAAHTNGADVFDVDDIVNDGCPDAGDAGSGGGATSHQARCADDTTKNNEDDDQWPADFNDDGTLNLQDVNSFVYPVKHFGQPAANHRRWNLAGGADINLQDVNLLSTVKPPMLYYTRAYGQSCPADDAFPPR